MLSLGGCGGVTDAEPEELTDPGPVDASFDRALSFDGVDDYASVGTARMPQIQRDQSLLLRFRPAGTRTGGADVQALFTLRRGRESGVVLALDRDVPLAYNVFGRAELARAPSNVTIDAWHRLAFVVRGDSCTLYVDGDVAAATTGQLLTNRTPIEGFIGSVNGFTQMFHGAIDDLRVYSRAFTLEEVQAVEAGMAPADAEQLVLYLPFDEAAGARAYDRSGLGNHAELGDGVPELMPARIRAEP